ncbi:MAG: hypothetical protein U0R78_19635 [Nocardioidaceae bacterium]
MTATVIPFTAKRRNPGPACGCTRHVLEALAARVESIAGPRAGELLTPASDLEAIATDVRATVAAVLADLNRRTNP